jgi:hypothetical protein
MHRKYTEEDVTLVLERMLLAMRAVKIRAGRAKGTLCCEDYEDLVPELTGSIKEVSALTQALRASVIKEKNSSCTFCKDFFPKSVKYFK